MSWPFPSCSKSIATAEFVTGDSHAHEVLEAMAVLHMYQLLLLLSICSFKKRGGRASEPWWLSKYYLIIKKWLIAIYKNLY